MSDASTSADGPPGEERQQDLYEVLGVQQTATEAEIKSAYKKAAIRWHPDKNQHQSAIAEAKFKDIATAYAVLSNPEKRFKYDSKGFDGLNENDLSEVEIDLSQMGTMNSVFAAMFSKLGVFSIKTMVAPSVLEMAESGSAELRPLDFGVPRADRVDKNCAHYYKLWVSQKDIDDGFCVCARSHYSRFKVLMFQVDGSGSQQLVLQDDSVKEGKHNTAGVYFFTFGAQKLGPPPSALQCADDPESALFRRLDSLERRDTCAIGPGEHVFAVYGDNFLKASHYELEAVRQADFEAPCGRIREVEGELMRKQGELRAFEQKYRAAKKAYEGAVLQFEEELRDLVAAVERREAEYAKLSKGGNGGGDGTLADAEEKSLGSQFRRMFRRT